MRIAEPVAEELIRQGALWNVFIIAARAGALLALFEKNAPELVLRMRQALHQDSGVQCDAMEALYRILAPVYFSRHILLGQESHLVVQVPSCGWTDLGTPERAADTLDRATLSAPTVFDHWSESGVLNLTEQHIWRQLLPSPRPALPCLPRTETHVRPVQ